MPEYAITAINRLNESFVGGLNVCRFFITIIGSNFHLIHLLTALLVLAGVARAVVLRGGADDVQRLKLFTSPALQAAQDRRRRDNRCSCEVSRRR